LLTGDQAMCLSQGRRTSECARDVSWHPHYPIIASTSFQGCINLWTP